MKKVIPEGSTLVPDTAQRVFEGKIFDAYQWPQEMFDGSSETFEMLKRPDTVSAICVVDGKIVVIDDEQPHTGSRKSFPGGRVDKTDANIEAAAKREVLEETGYSFKSWRLISVGQPHTKIEWFVHVLMAWDVAGKQATNHDAGERITVHGINFDELKTLIINKSGYLADATSIFENIESLEQLLSMPEFTGQNADR